jgi:hypothetical protein
MKVKFTKNAVTRMLDRGIGEADVRATLDAPDHLGPSFEKRWLVRKKLETRTLEVVFYRQCNQAQVITTYWQESSA